MILIKNINHDSAKKIAQNLDYIDNFENLDLMDFSILELTELEGASPDWYLGKPLIYDEQDGILIIEFSKESLSWFKDNVGTLVTYGVSEKLLYSFCLTPTDGLYSIETF